MLRIVIARLLLGFYLLAIFKPFLPHLEYAFNKVYIIQQLCENRFRPEMKCEGKCYLARRLAQAEETHEPENKPVSPKSGLEKELVHLFCDTEVRFSDQNASSLLRIAAAFDLCSPFHDDIFHPPRQFSVSG